MANSKSLEPLQGDVIIDDEKMLVKKHYEHIISYAPSSDELDDLFLKLTTLPYEPNTLHRVLLDSGGYYSFANPNNIWLEFKCNVEIVGVYKYEEKASVRKYFFNDVLVQYDGSLTEIPGDFIIGSKRFGELYFSNIIYEIISDSFVAKVHEDKDDSVFMLKACGGKSIVVKNCQFFDNQHGRLTNIDVRDVEYIDICSNTLVSEVIVDAAVEKVNEGGNIWIRDGFKACSIIDNKLYHTGIDEMIGIIGGS